MATRATAPGTLGNEGELIAGWLRHNSVRVLEHNNDPEIIEKIAPRRCGPAYVESSLTAE